MSAIEVLQTGAYVAIGLLWAIALVALAFAVRCIYRWSRRAAARIAQHCRYRR